MSDNALAVPTTVASIATDSGVLAGILARYLLARYNHLLLIYPSARTMRERLGQLAAEAAQSSFFYFCRTVHAIDRMQRDANEAHAIDFALSERLQRLLNTFLLNIPDESAHGIDTYNIVRAVEFQCRSTPAQKVCDLNINDFMHRVRERELLPGEFDEYSRWLSISPRSLVVATEVLSTYALELRRRIARLSGLEEIAGGDRGYETDWAETLSPSAYGDLCGESPLPRPLGQISPERPLEALSRLAPARGEATPSGESPAGTAKPQRGQVVDLEVVLQVLKTVGQIPAGDKITQIFSQSSIAGDVSGRDSTKRARIVNAGNVSVSGGGEDG